MTPFIIVSTLRHEDRESVVQFLLRVRAPALVESVSGIREDERLQSFIVKRPPAELNHVIRIGGVPTHRYWRDLENKKDELSVISISHLPFSGLSWGELRHGNIPSLLDQIDLVSPPWEKPEEEELFSRFPQSEPALLHTLSKSIPEHSLIYLGNSMPIRQWDLAATYENRHYDIQASRGVNGIDGQLSTFLGLCRPGRENWAIVGDLTTLYDLAAPWIVPQLESMSINIVVINNGGGKIFSRMYSRPEFQNKHTLDFKPFAQMWGFAYEKWKEIPSIMTSTSRLIELIPSEIETNQFWDAYQCATLSTAS